MRKFLFLFWLISYGFSQQLPWSSQDFLALPNSPLLTALGGKNVSIKDRDLAVASFNPAVLDSSDAYIAEFSFIDYFAGISYGFSGFSIPVTSEAFVYASVKYMNYGEFVQADPYGNKIGTFTGNNFLFTLGASRHYGKFRAGMNINFYYSELANVSASGLTADFGGLYTDKERGLDIGFAVNNLGKELKSYAQNPGIQGLPTEILLGITKRVPHTPFRLSLTFQELQSPKLVYRTSPEEEVKWHADFIRHVIFGTEILLGKNLNLQFGYNFRRRRELKPPEKAFTLTGLGLGVAIKIKGFNIRYAYTGYYSVGGMNSLGISKNIQDFWKK